MELDLAQKQIDKKLSELADLINIQTNERWFKKLFKKKLNSPVNLSSIYIYGGVGRGKTMLMQKFYQSITTNNKIYFHFNSFMRSIHSSLHQIRQQQIKCNDELILALQNILTSNNQNNIPKVICFDEFQVLDIADAMLLSRIFTFIFKKNIIVIFTSNLPPQKLYENGLQRELFMQFINNIFLKKITAINLDSTTDYRTLALNSEVSRYLSDKKLFDELLNKFCYQKNKLIKKINVWGRVLTFDNSYENILEIDINNIISQDLYSSDFQEICKNYDLIFLKNLYQFNADNINEIKRFTLFIDEVYENKVGLIIYASHSPYELLSNYLINKKFQFFLRTISRIEEIKSQKYWQECKFWNK